MSFETDWRWGHRDLLGPAAYQTDLSLSQSIKCEALLLDQRFAILNGLSVLCFKTGSKLLFMDACVCDLAQ